MFWQEARGFDASGLEKPRFWAIFKAKSGFFKKTVAEVSSVQYIPRSVSLMEENG
jgi:hypothetical protein